jgi:hypothetical protein
MAVTAANLNRKDEALLAALLIEPTIATAAAKAGMPERTAYRRIAEPDFAQAYRTARREAVSQATARLQNAAGAAVDALASIVGDAGAPANTRVVAARVILENTLRASELEEVTARLDELEGKLAELKEPEAQQWAA